ncbi:MAG: PKD domain-containing protein [Microthrixaceae bacterium]
MEPLKHSVKRRVVAVLAATAVVVTTLGLGLGAVEAGSSVVPSLGTKGPVVYGTFKGAPKRAQTALIKVDLNGTPSYLFCIDLGTLIELGANYEESSWSESNVANLAKVTRVLAQSSATTSHDPTEIGATQAAIWHFSDGFALDTSNPANSPALVARYNDLVADANAHPVTEEPTGSLNATPRAISVANGKPAFVNITTTATGPLSLELSNSLVTAHPASGDQCDLDTKLTTVTGNTRICLTAGAFATTASLTIRTDAAPVNAGRVFLRPGRQKLIIGKRGTAQSSANVAATWTANGRPTVSITCPTTGVTFGQPATFSAAADDPDGDPLVYLWTLDGKPIPDHTDAAITIALQQGQRLGVTVSDPGGSSASATAGCAGANPPSVTLRCPEQMTLGSDVTFNATGTDPDGDTLTYVWTLNGEAVPGQSGSALTVTVHAGDTLSVVAKDPTGLTSAAVDASCIPTATNRAPSVTLSCPRDFVGGQPATFTAVGTDPDGDPLTYSWSVDGSPVPGQNTATATITAKSGQKVSVTANDGKVSGAATTVTCTGEVPNQPPTVSVSCPANLVWGTPATFTAKGTDPEGDTLAYEWKVNGKVVSAQTGPSAKLTVAKGDVVTVAAVDKRGAKSTTATANCPGNTPPRVSLKCPARVLYGEPFDLAASGTDADGDALTFTWTLNGRVLDGQTAATATIVLSSGDKVGVTVRDARGATSATTTVTCAGTTRPKVTISCPDNLVWGEPASFIANGTDADGDTDLVYSWYLGNTPVATGTSPKLVIAVGEHDVLTVTATDSTNTVSDTARADCTGNHRPSVTMTCPADLVFGSPSVFTATATDPDGDSLTYKWSINGTTVDGQTKETATLTLARDDKVSVEVADTEGLAAAPVTSTCVGNTTPKVSLACPDKVVFGEPAAFEAKGTDADGDSLVYRWSIDGVVVDGASSNVLHATLTKAVTVSVEVVDAKGLTSSTTADCTGKTRPAVTLKCPTDLQFGRPTSLRATTTGAGDQDVTYTWTHNGVVLPGATGPTVTLTLQPDDRVGVAALSDGVAASQVDVNCTGITKTPAPSAPEVLSAHKAQSQRIAKATKGALAVTGTQALTLAGLALGLVALGLGLTWFGGRRRHTRS